MWAAGPVSWGGAAPWAFGELQNVEKTRMPPPCLRERSQRIDPQAAGQIRRSCRNPGGRKPGKEGADPPPGPEAGGGLRNGLLPRMRRTG